MSGYAQQVAKIPLANSAGEIRRGAFARLVGFHIHFEPPKSADDAHLAIGDSVSGATEAPSFSDNRKSSCTLGWRRDGQYFDTKLEMGQVGPGVSPEGIHLNPNVMWNLPTLGADSSAPSPNEMALVLGVGFERFARPVFGLTLL